MENKYRKIFPDLMTGKKILYIHGFMSSGATHTAEILQECMPNSSIISPDIPIHPQEAIDLLRKIQKENKPDLIVGTSMGGIYTEMLYGTDRICVNPAFQMGSTITENNMLGKQVFQNPRKDGIQEVIITKSIQKEYKAITECCFNNITKEEQDRVYGLFGDKDEIVHTFNLFATHYINAIHFHGEHRLIEKTILHYLIPVIRWIDDKQENKERKTILIDLNATKDNFNKPKSALQKAYEILIETYNVFFIVPAPTNYPARLIEDQKWIEQTFSAPAWNHIIFSNQPEMVIADYLISTKNIKEFMGTCIKFGNNDFKTWEDIIIYFKRLNGQ